MFRLINSSGTCMCICSQSLAEAKKQNSALVERLQTMQTELSESELRRTQVETQMRQTHDVYQFILISLFNVHKV